MPGDKNKGRGDQRSNKPRSDAGKNSGGRAGGHHSRGRGRGRGDRDGGRGRGEARGGHAKAEDWSVAIVFRVNPATYELEVLLERTPDSRCGWSLPCGKADHLEDGHMNYVGGPIRLLRERFGCGPEGIEFHDAMRGLVLIDKDPLDARAKDVHREFTHVDGPGPAKMLHFRHFMCPAWVHSGWRSWTPELTDLQLAKIGALGGHALTLNKKVICPQDTLVCWVPIGDLKIGYRQEDFNDDLIRLWYEKTGHGAENAEKAALSVYHSHLAAEPCRVTAVYGYNLDAAVDPAESLWMDESVDGQKMWQNWNEAVRFLLNADGDTAAQCVQYCFKSTMLVEAFKRWEDAGQTALLYETSKIRGVPQGADWSKTEGGQQILENFVAFLRLYITFDDETQMQCISHCFDKYGLLTAFKKYYEHQDLPHDPDRIHL